MELENNEVQDSLVDRAMATHLATQKNTFEVKQCENLG